MRPWDKGVAVRWWRHPLTQTQRPCLLSVVLHQQLDVPRGGLGKMPGGLWRPEVEAVGIRFSSSMYLL